MKDDVFATLLHKKLLKLNIPFGGVGQNGIVYDVDGKTQIQNRPDIAAVIAQGVSDPLEDARGKNISTLTPPMKDALLAEVCERLGITIDGIVQ